MGLMGIEHYSHLYILFIAFSPSNSQLNAVFVASVVFVLARFIKGRTAIHTNILLL
jgi:hypothetical protein